jgi:hypothetical protein
MPPVNPESQETSIDCFTVAVVADSHRPRDRRRQSRSPASRYSGQHRILTAIAATPRVKKSIDKNDAIRSGNFPSKIPAMRRAARDGGKSLIFDDASERQPLAWWRLLKAP